MPLPFIVTTWGPCWWRGGVIAHFLVSGSVLVEEACRLVANACEPLRYGAVAAVAEDLADVGEGGDSAAQDDHYFAVAGLSRVRKSLQASWPMTSVSGP